MRFLFLKKHARSHIFIYSQWYQFVEQSERRTSYIKHVSWIGLRDSVTSDNIKNKYKIDHIPVALVVHVGSIASSLCSYLFY